MLANTATPLYNESTTQEVNNVADQDQLDVLRQGRDAWNTWKEQHPKIRPDLSHANLSRADLGGADLRRANLSRADLSFADLSQAALFDTNLSGAHLYKANLSGAHLSAADLYKANLSSTNLSAATFSHANLSGADLSGADLSGADLRRANLSGANLSSADLSSTTVEWTQFDNLDLRTVRGLETVEHRSPSSIGIDTIYRSQGHIPETFLRQAGVPDDFLTYIHSLVAHPIEYYTCFISYSSRDQAFAERLYTDLHSKGVRCWFAPAHMHTGDKIRQRIDESIRLYEKLLLLLSEHSIANSWVEFELEAALAKEDEKHALVLFPVRLDHAVMQSTTSWAAHLKRMRHITDFTGWKQHDDYQKALTRLFRDLQPDNPQKESTP